MSGDNELSPELIELLANDDEGLFDAPVKPRRITTEDRLERAFIEVLEFYDEHKRRPDPTTRDIAERKLGARLVGIINSEEKKEQLAHLDDVGLLEEEKVPDSLDDLLGSDDSDDFLGGLLDDDDDEDSLYDTGALPKNSPKTPDDVAIREKAKDFDNFRELFKNKQRELEAGEATLVDFVGEDSVLEGRFYLLKGQLAFVAEMHDPTPNAPLTSSGKPKGRLRVIFENGTESSMYRQSFATRLYESGGKALARTGGFDASEIGDADVESGRIYVLRSLSEDPEIKQLNNLYKIGFSTTSVEQRIKGAEKSPTYLNAPVEVVAVYRTYNLRPSALEHLLHRVFANVRLDISVGSAQWQQPEPSQQRDVTEWFIAPLEAINDAIEKIMTGEITDYEFDKAQQRLVPRVQ